MTSEAQPLSSLGLARGDTRARERTAREPAVVPPATPHGAPSNGSLPPAAPIGVPPDTPASRNGSGSHEVACLPTTGGRAAAPASRALRADLFAIDVACVVATWLVLALWFPGPSPWSARIGPALAAEATALLALRAVGLYRSRLCARRSDELARIAAANLLAGTAFVVAQLGVRSATAEAVVVAGAGTVLLGAVRWEFGRILRSRRAEGRYLRGVVLVGTNQDAVELRTMLRSEPELGYAVTAVIGDEATAPTWSDLPSGQSIADIPKLAATTHATGILVVPCSLPGATVQGALAVAASCGLHAQVWPGHWGVGSRRLRSVPVDGEPFFYVEPRHVPTWQMGVKRAIDVVGAAAGLLVASPVLVAAALLVKLEDGGPVLFGGTRIGKQGRPFVAYKLRSMSPEGAVPAEQLARLNERTDGPLFKAARDPRVTKVGRFLRASSIDELPQLWNVLRGTMSLVGPRPALPSEVDQFDEELRRRHSVRPGLTGLWQVQARRNPSFHAYRRLDIRYVDDWSLTLDLAILMSTVPCVLSHAVRELRDQRR